MKAIGIESGIGSMLYPAKLNGFDIVGNIDTRSQFHSGTFEENFQGSFMQKTLKDINYDIDLMLCHPKCGNFSSLSWANSTGKKDISDKQSTFPFVKEAIKKYKPAFFVIDNLPKSLIGSPLLWWANGLENYRLSAEFVSNYRYGNTQKGRNRLFIIGWRKEFDFRFIPGETEVSNKVSSLISDLTDSELVEINHEFYKDEMPAPNMSPMKIKEAREFFKDFKEGINPSYYKNEKGKCIYCDLKDVKKYEDILKKRIGTKKIFWEKHSHVITSATNFYHPIRNDPLTCRERARIQGFSDNFIFVLKSNFSRVMGCQTGQAIPFEFMNYLTYQIKCFLENEPFESSCTRYLSDDMIEKNKMEYCKEYGKKEIECTYCVCKPFCTV